MGCVDGPLFLRIRKGRLSVLHIGACIHDDTITALVTNVDRRIIIVAL
jgi:hypothetical protein